MLPFPQQQILQIDTLYCPIEIIQRFQLCTSSQFCSEWRATPNKTANSYVIECTYDFLWRRGRGGRRALRHGSTRLDRSKW